MDLRNALVEAEPNFTGCIRARLRMELLYPPCNFMGEMIKQLFQLRFCSYLLTMDFDIDHFKLMKFMALWLVDALQDLSIHFIRLFARPEVVPILTDSFLELIKVSVRHAFRGAYY